MPATAFALPDHLAVKADPALVADDERHFAAIAESLDATIAELSDRLAAERRAPGGSGQSALERDQEIHRLTARLRTLRRFGLDLCLGRMVFDDGPDDEPAEPVYVGRLGLTDSDGNRLLVDWRSPAAAPFFGATHAEPSGLASRRRYRWSHGVITDYWDEVFTADGLTDRAALDDQSAFLASLGGARSERMRDVLATIQSDQDAIIRAGSRGALVVDGGPGTGKTVVALHRAAYLLHADPRLRQGHGGLLFIGPHQPYLSYVADVLPNLGEEGVRTCTLRHLVTEGASAVAELDPEVARLKADARLVQAIEAAVAFYEEPPTTALTVTIDDAQIRVRAADWAEAFRAAEPGIAHNEAREPIRAELLTLLVDRYGGDDADDDAAAVLRDSLARSRELSTALDRAWPMLEATDVVGDLWSVPAYLRRCAPWLTREQITLLQRENVSTWTDADLPLLDAARRRLGDPGSSLRTRQLAAATAARREQMTTVIDDLIAADDSEMQVMSMLRGEDLAAAFVGDEDVAPPDVDALAGPFAHVVVDEAQELTDAEWQMVLLRCPSRSVTIVGDRAQARHGFMESWQERLVRVGFDDPHLVPLTVNYRTPSEIMAEAEPVIRAALPDANVPTSIRSNGMPVLHGSTHDLESVLERWELDNVDGTACVIGDPTFTARPRVHSSTPQLVKGLEFDLVVLVDPRRFGDGIEGAVDRYVSMTRATGRLVVLTTG